MFPKWFHQDLVRTCQWCGKKFYPTEWKTNKRIYRESKVRYTSKIFCNLICRAEELKNRDPQTNYFYGKHLTPWNKGKKHDYIVKQTSGYMRIIKIDGSIDYVHRRIVNCPKGMVVHHIDRNRSNNSISNLLILTPSEHIKLHKEEKHGNKIKQMANNSME